MVTCSSLLSSPELLPPAERVTLAVSAENTAGIGGTAVVLRLLTGADTGPRFERDIYPGKPLVAGHDNVAECAKVKSTNGEMVIF